MDGGRPMCEVLVRVANKANDDPYRTAQLLQRGDVVVVVEDEHAWGPAELSNPDWRILKLPNVSVNAALAFLGPELDSNPGKPSLMLRPRAFRFDLEHGALPAAFKAWLADSSRKRPARALDVTEAQFAATKVRKAALADPNIL